MRRKSIKAAAIITFPIVFIALLGVNIYISSLPCPNRQIFLSNLAKLEDGAVVELKEIATFDWDKMYIVTPYGGRSIIGRLEKRYSLNIRSRNLSSCWPSFPRVYLMFINDNRQVAGFLSDMEFFIAPSITPLSFYAGDDNYFVAERRNPESQRVTLSRH